MMDTPSGAGQVFQRIVAEGSSRVHMGNVFNYDVAAQSKYEECLRSLFLTNPRDDLAAIRRSKGSRVEGTCEWILSHNLYKQWRNAPLSRLLRLFGSPGIGKSMLASYLVEELENTASKKSETELFYYFCDNKDEKRNTALSVARTLLWQLLRLKPSLYNHVQPEYEQTTNLPENFDALWRILLNAIEDADFGELYIVIDALDECDAFSREVLMNNIKDAIIRWEKNGVLVKVLFTSRPEVDIEESFDQAHGCDGLRVDSGKINVDLKAFISSKVADVVRRKHWPLKWTEKMCTALSAQSGGTFLWASLVLDDISKVKTTKMIEAKLANLPQDLTQVYDRILLNIGEEYVETAVYILRWVVVAQRPLSVSELAMAQALNPVDYEGRKLPPLDLLEDCEDSYKCCIPLLERDPTTNAINLIHQSAKDYLVSSALSKSEKLAHYYVNPGLAHVLASRTCFKLLCCEEFDDAASEIDSKLDRGNSPKWWNDDHVNPGGVLLSYAAASWDDHCTLIPEASIASLAYFEELSTYRPSLCRSWLSLATSHEQAGIVRQLIDRFPQSIDCQDRYGRTALFFVKSAGLTRLLLVNGANFQAKSKGNETALHNAVSSDYNEVVETLVEYGAEVDSSNHAGETPLFKACSRETVRILVEKGADVNARSIGKETALHKIRNAAVLQELLDHGADVDASNYRGWTAFHRATCENRADSATMAKVLLRNGADINARGDNGQTALSRVSRYGYLAMAQMLLDEGADPNIVDKSGKTALDMAEELKSYREITASEYWLLESQAIIDLLFLKGGKRGLEVLRSKDSTSSPFES